MSTSRRDFLRWGMGLGAAAIVGPLLPAIPKCGIRVGPEGKLTSKHYDHMIMDDVVSTPADEDLYRKMVDLWSQCSPAPKQSLWLLNDRGEWVRPDKYKED